MPRNGSPYGSSHFWWNPAVCSCTILPLFTSIYKRGAGLGPAVAFLYSGPAISILSIILTARILGFEMGVARIIGAVLFSVIIGLAMSFIFRKEEKAKKEEQMNIVPPPEKRPMWQTSFHFFTLVLILVFANWGAPASSDTGLWYYIFTYKWYIVGALSLLLCWSLVRILKLRVLGVVLGAMATAVSVILANLFIDDTKLIPLVPMIVAIPLSPSSCSLTNRIRKQGMGNILVGLRQTDIAVAGYRCSDSRFPAWLNARQYSHCRCHSEQLDRMGSRG